MIIRSEQTEQLSKTAETGYVSSAVKHLQEYDPLLAAAAGKPGLEKVAKRGLASARGYGLGNGRPLQLYLELMMSLGSGFDTDPQFGWLHSFLRPMEGVGTVERARLLHFHVMAYLDRAYGKNGEHGAAALERTLQLNTDRLRRAGEDFGGRGPKLLEWVHPQRMEFLEPAAISELLSEARARASRAGLPLPEGEVFLFLLMFAFGHNVCDDPLHPWLARALAEGTEAPNARMERMLSRTRDYVTMMLRQLRRASA